jgi:hypothetical protein
MEKQSWCCRVTVMQSQHLHISVMIVFFDKHTNRTCAHTNSHTH